MRETTVELRWLPAPQEKVAEGEEPGRGPEVSFTEPPPPPSSVALIIEPLAGSAKHIRSFEADPSTPAGCHESQMVVPILVQLESDDGHFDANWGTRLVQEAASPEELTISLGHIDLPPQLRLSTDFGELNEALLNLTIFEGMTRGEITVYARDCSGETCLSSTWVLGGWEEVPN